MKHLYLVVGQHYYSSLVPIEYNQGTDSAWHPTAQGQQEGNGNGTAPLVEDRQGWKEDAEKDTETGHRR